MADLIRIKRDPIEIPSEKMPEFVRRLKRMESQGREFQSGWPQLNRDNWAAYLGRLEGVFLEEEPFPGATRYFANLTRVAVDTNLSQYSETLITGDRRVVGSDEAAAERLTDFYFNIYYKKRMSLDSFLYNLLLYTLVQGVDVFENFWASRMTVRRGENPEIRPRNRTEKIEFMGVDTTISLPTSENIFTIREDLSLRRRNRVVMRRVPMADFFLSPETRISDDCPINLEWPNCPWYFKRMYWSREDVRARLAETDGRKPAYAQKPLQDAMARFRLRDLSEEEREKLEHADLSPVMTKGLEVLRFTMREVMPGRFRKPGGGFHEQTFMSSKGIPEDVYVWFLPETDEVIRVLPVGRVRPDGRRGDIDIGYKPYGSFYRMGVPQALRHSQYLMNRFFNQAGDWGTIRNMPWFMYQPHASGLLDDSLQLVPGQGVPVGGSVTFPRFQGDEQFHLRMMAELQKWSERDVNFTDFMAGRSSQLPNAPRTFRGLATILSQGEKNFSKLSNLMKEPLLEMFRQVHVLFQKHSFQMDEEEFSRVTADPERPLFDRFRVTRSDFMGNFDISWDINPNINQERQDSLTVLQTLQPVLIETNPAGLRMLYEDFYVKHVPDGRQKFKEIWPEGLAPQVQQPQPGQEGQAEPSAFEGVPDNAARNPEEPEIMGEEFVA